MKAHHLGQRSRPFHLIGFVKAHPVGGDVAGVAHGYEQVIGRGAEVVHDFECGRLLPLQPIRVERIDQHDGMLGAELAHDAEGVVEAAVDKHNLRAVGYRLRHFAARDVVSGDKYDGGQPAARAVCGGGCAGVAGGGAHNRSTALFQRLGDGYHHAPVLERAGGIAALQLEIELAAA